MPIRRLLLLLLSAAPLLLRAEPAKMDVFVSTGDNHFLGSSLPIDSPASIEATFDLFKNVNHARRIYWRGLEEACWVSTMQARPENRRYFSLWEWMQWLYANVHPDQLAVKAAHQRGMEIWGVGTLWDWGGPADTPTFGDYPFPFESKLKLEHPEWAPVDKHGARRQGGPIELAYPEARKALVDLVVRETLAAGYDGITFLTYAENYSMRFEDEFGYSEPIVREFKKLHGIDITKEPFKRGATQEDWIRLRGTYVTAFLRELKAALEAHRVKVGMIVNPNDAHSPLPWNVPELMITAGPHYLDLETWIRDGLVQDLCVYGNSSRLAQAKTIADLQFLCRGTPCAVSFMTSSPLDPGWAPIQKAGIATVLAVSDDAQHLGRGFIPEQKLTGLKSESVWERLRTLQMIIDGKLQAPQTGPDPLVDAANLIGRRMALEALGKLKSPAAVPVVERALSDPENGVRCVAALALGEISDPKSCDPLLDAVAKNGNHMLVECAVIALRKLKPFPAEQLAEAALHRPEDRVREVALRALQPFARADMLPVFQAALNDKEPFARYVAADALGNIRKSPAAVESLLEALHHADLAVANRAALSLGSTAGRNEPELAELRPKMLAALEAAFRQTGQSPIPVDGDWGFRVVGNALRAAGKDGVEILRRLRDQRDNFRLAELAWRVLDLHQEPNTFSRVTQAENEAAFARRPLPNDPTRHVLLVDPKTGSDTNDGRARPLKTIARAVRLAQPGDTISLAPGRYFESIDLSRKEGTPEKPITVEGNGAVLDGSEPVRAADWEALGGGLFRKLKLLPRIDDAIVGRWFFVWNGKMNHMGRTSKGPSAALKKPADLRPGEWTYAKDEDAFYVRIDPAQSLDAANIRYPARSSGVVESGGAAHLIVRNTIATHVYNDGYNIHGSERDCVFENIAAIECGDDGFSAHEDAECRIDGFVSIGNSTGLCDTVSSITHYKNVFIRDCLGYDVFFIGDSPHSIENAIVESSAARAFEAGRHTDRPQGDDCRVLLRNVLFRRVGGGPQEIHVSRDTRVTVDHCTFLNLNVRLASGAEMSVTASRIGGIPKPELFLTANTLWRGEENAYDLGAIHYDQQVFSADKFVNFQKLTGSEKDSRWGQAPAAAAGAKEDDLAALDKRANDVLRAWQEAK